MNKGDFMAERKQVPIFESCYKIAEYLKKNTDKDHPTTEAAMRSPPHIPATHWESPERREDGEVSGDW